MDKYVYEGMGLQNLLAGKNLKKKNIIVYPVRRDWENDPAGLRNFMKTPEHNPLVTPSGKLEFYSERLARTFPDDKERRPIPTGSKIVKRMMKGFPAPGQKYPLLMMSNHGRWRVHAQCDDIPWTREIPPVRSRDRTGICMNRSGYILRTAAEKRHQNMGHCQSL